ncbi:hypothetical protein M2161_007212 [Streptomyces sp. SAI-133]|nr:hypothetical protein [Streptomyces sp. SAI-133]
MRTRWRSNRPAYPAPSATLSGRAASARDRRTNAAGSAESTSAATVAPAAASPVATGSSSGPVPATTAVRPGSTSPPLSMACAPPAVTTPGRVQPGKGSTFS